MASSPANLAAKRLSSKPLTIRRSPARTCHSHESGERPWMVTSRNFAGWYFSILRICAACRSFSRSDLEIQYRTEMTLVVTVLVGTHMAIGPYR